MQTIIKLESRQEVTPSGRIRTIYRKTEYKPGHPDYEKEKAIQDEYLRMNHMPKAAGDLSC